MIFVEFDSDFSAEEDQFCDPKSFNRHGHQNLSLAVYENLANPEAKGRWEVGFAISDHGVQNISFVNSINTIKVKLKL